MDLKRKWKSFYHRLARIKTHGAGESTTGLVLHNEILTLIRNAEKELVVIDIASEPIFLEPGFWTTLMCRVRSLQGFKARLFFYARPGEAHLLETLKQKAGTALEESCPESNVAVTLFSLHEEPYVLCYLSEKELLIKDALEGESRPVSLKFDGDTMFTKDARRYLEYLEHNPEIVSQVFCGDSKNNHGSDY